MILKVIASSSKGNAYILDNGKHQLLIECGVKMQDIKAALDFDLTKIAGCLISHEHSDHSKCVKDVIGCGIDVYASKGTNEANKLIKSHRIHSCEPLKPFEIMDFQIYPFPVEHDCAEPFGYVIYDLISKQRVLFATDTHMLQYKFKNVDHYLIECNYDEDTISQNNKNGTLEGFRYQRILDSHMGLNTLVDAIKSHTGTPKTITLIHLSDQNINEGTVTTRIYKEFGLMPNIADTGITIELT